MGHAAAIRPSSAFVTVDFDKPGKQIGFLMIPHSPHEDAWGVTQVPLAVIANGRGPTVIIEGGNHGDEYEGPITIGELIRDLDPDEVQGRLILMPANNVHAVRAGRRTSPVDGLNFNRSFPGDPRGSITEQIAAYVVDHYGRVSLGWRDRVVLPLEVDLRAVALDPGGALPEAAGRVDLVEADGLPEALRGGPVLAPQLECHVLEHE